MEWLRYGRDAYGEVIINGVSWDLLPVAFGAGVAVIVVHLIVRALTGRSSPRDAAASSNARTHGAGEHERETAAD